MAAMTCSMVGRAILRSDKQLSLDRGGLPRVEAVLRPAPSMDEQMEEPGIDEHPQDVRCRVLVEALAEFGALGEAIPYDVPRPDPALGSDRLEAVAALGIRPRRAAHGLIDGREP